MTRVSMYSTQVEFPTTHSATGPVSLVPDIDNSTSRTRELEQAGPWNTSWTTVAATTFRLTGGRFDSDQPAGSERTVFVIGLTFVDLTQIVAPVAAVFADHPMTVHDSQRISKVTVGTSESG